MKQLRLSRVLPSVIARVLVAATIPVALFAGISSADTPPANTITLTAPSNIPGVAALPFTGLTAPAFTVPATFSNLTVTADQGVTGTPMVVSGSGLPANSSVELTWSTNSATWLADVEPNTVNYLGTSYSKFTVVMATVTTDGSGSFSYSTKAPAN